MTDPTNKPQGFPSKPIGWRLPGPPVVRVPVKRIGRNTKHLYCERCGQKRKACQCQEHN